MVLETSLKYRFYCTGSGRRSQLHLIAKLLQHSERTSELASLLFVVEPIVASIIIYRALVQQMEYNLQNFVTTATAAYLPPMRVGSVGKLLAKQGG